jgi:hypothetical protein
MRRRAAGSGAVVGVGWWLGEAGCLESSLELASLAGSLWQLCGRCNIMQCRGRLMAARTGGGNGPTFVFTNNSYVNSYFTMSSQKVLQTPAPPSISASHPSYPTTSSSSPSTSTHYHLRRTTCSSSLPPSLSASSPLHYFVCLSIGFVASIPCQHFQQ